MIHRRHCPPDTPNDPVEYDFLKPAVLRIRRPDGRVDVIGYGIGDRITVLEPTLVYLIGSREILDEIPLADNQGTIIEYPTDICVHSQYGWIDTIR